MSNKRISAIGIATGRRTSWLCLPLSSSAASVVVPKKVSHLTCTCADVVSSEWPRHFFALVYHCVIRVVLRPWQIVNGVSRVPIKSSLPTIMIPMKSKQRKKWLKKLFVVNV